MPIISTLLSVTFTLISVKYYKGRKRKLLGYITPHMNAQETHKKTKYRNHCFAKAEKYHILQIHGLFQVSAINWKMKIFAMLPSWVNQIEQSHRCNMGPSEKLLNPSRKYTLSYLPPNSTTDYHSFVCWDKWKNIPKTNRITCL